ncbi:bifunctional phosphatase PAP2/diacylglycerol kinase family protein [Nocardia sp. CDC160]|uniref:bifunctional phosphatase PAP2/diacylglycerol kinase family protein n=1 Tax=Nocardia sp. CDC160 TaxID=3112166 RepID=UPI002DB744D5|nr:phosphatase PAP2 family protein [Nocardia sp. CDC160]MEC3918360.1 phosphatase PAP2 family protein [Nocardia sp. CDC160]
MTARSGFRRVGRFDRAITAAIAEIPPSRADVMLLRVTRSADFGLLWLVSAGVLATRKGSPRRAAVRGVAALTGASVLVNSVLKPIIGRRRPAAELLPVRRRLTPRPRSSSFPSGHSAAAAAFATAVALENPRAARVLAPLAAVVAYSRIHTGVHWGSDVVAGAAVGSGFALATRHWWPARPKGAAHARAVRDAPCSVEGKGMVVLVNPAAGNPAVDVTAEIAEALPAALLVHTEPDGDPADRLDETIRQLSEPITALGVAGGDGTVAAAATFALRHGLPLAVIPTGTLNHFARDLGVLGLDDTVEALRSGSAVAVDIAHVDFDDDKGARSEQFINTAGLGIYPDVVRLRRKWESRCGKWPAFAAALVVATRRARPFEVHMDGRRLWLWSLFIGNGGYHPHGAVPAFRDDLTSGLFDIRWLRADLPWSRTRTALAVLLATLDRTPAYGERLASELRLRLSPRQNLTADGEMIGTTTTLHFRLAGRLTVYRAT